MLSHLPQALTPDLYQILYQMGHGDRIVIADANFPAYANARRVYAVPDSNACDILKLVSTFIPTDTFTDDAVVLMEVAVGDCYEPTIQQDFLDVLRQQQQLHAQPRYLPRASFYEATREAFAVILTGEKRRYGNIMLRKGVIDFL